MATAGKHLSAGRRALSPLNRRTVGGKTGAVMEEEERSGHTEVHVAFVTTSKVNAGRREIKDTELYHRRMRSCTIRVNTVKTSVRAVCCPASQRLHLSPDLTRCKRALKRVMKLSPEETLAESSAG